MTTAAEKVGPAADTATIAPADKIEKTADKRRALGRGLDSLLPSGPRVVAAAAVPIPSATVPVPGNAGGASVSRVVPSSGTQSTAGDAVIQIPLERIDPNPYQTRVEFDPETLQELAESIRATGVVQPIVVRPGADGRYLLVLGERRCRASKLAGKLTIPAMVRRVSDQQAAEMTVVENLQRADLNCMEQAAAFNKLSKEFNLTQQQIGDRVGMSRESVANYMRLLKLPATVKEYLLDGSLGFSEARELLKLEDDETITKTAAQAIAKHWSVHQLMDVIENVIMKQSLSPQAEQAQGARWVDPNVRAAQNELQRILGVRVKIRDRKGKGRIVIEYSSVDDYERVVEMLKGKA